MSFKKKEMQNKLKALECEHTEMQLFKRNWEKPNTVIENKINGRSETHAGREGGNYLNVPVSGSSRELNRYRYTGR